MIIKEIEYRDKWIDSYVRPERNRLLSIADNRVRRYENQVKLGMPTVDSEQTILKVLQYMQILRDITKTAHYDTLEWPIMP